MVRPSRKMATTFAPGRRKRRLRRIEPAKLDGRPVSRLITTSPSRNFPMLWPLTESRNSTYAAPAAAASTELSVQYRKPSEMTINPSIIAADRRREMSAFAYGDARPLESFDTIGKYAMANATAGKTKTPARTLESISKKAILQRFSLTRSADL